MTKKHFIIIVHYNNASSKKFSWHKTVAFKIISVEEQNGRIVNDEEEKNIAVRLIGTILVG